MAKFIETSKIDPNPYQTRFTYETESMEELKASIKQLGIVTPLVVRPIGDRFQLVSGSRRLLAAKELGLKEVPCVIKELSDKEAMEITITENLQRQDLNPIEEALGFQRLIEEFNYTHEKLAERLGKSRSYITNSLRLLKLNWQVQFDVLYKTISPWHARCLLQLDDFQQWAFANLIIDWNWSVEETKENVKRFLNGERYLTWIREIPIESINAEGRFRKWNNADEKKFVKSLSESIKEFGLMNPIKIYVHGTLIDGFGRLKACKMLGWKLIPAVIHFETAWLKMAVETNVLHKTMEGDKPKGNPILDKLVEMKVEPYHSYHQNIMDSLCKEMTAIQKIMEEVKG
ncbi:ParB/RepB/Spo0J family partition protein [Candidatus Bathyarchaeota archaeon]|nr:ParB/RepB/Spo0J family partition protein [Candidatus Bathyarchaeota archaeon]